MTRLFESYRKRVNYRRTYNELSRLSDRVLADIGISRGDIDRVARVLSE